MLSSTKSELPRSYCAALRLGAGFCCAIGLLVSAQPAHATLAWNGTTTSNPWFFNPANWGNHLLPWNNDAVDVSGFYSTAPGRMSIKVWPLTIRTCRR